MTPGHRLKDAFDRVTHHALRPLPAGLASGAGALLGDLFERHARLVGKPWPVRTLANLRALEDPSITPGDRAISRGVARQIGRTMTEFSVLGALSKPGRLAIDGLDRAAASPTPTVFVSIHTGNWELAYHVCVLAGRSFATLYDPPLRPARHRIAVESRHRSVGRTPSFSLIRACRTAPRRLIETLDAGHDVLIYVDERKDGLIWNPPLGRTLPFAGNRALAARLAVRAGKGGAPVVPIHVLRTRGARFSATVGPALPSAPDARTMADAIATYFDPIVRANLRQWFWITDLDLDRAFPEIVTCRAEPRDAVRPSAPTTPPHPGATPEATLPR